MSLITKLNLGGTDYTLRASAFTKECEPFETWTSEASFNSSSHNINKLHIVANNKLYWVNGDGNEYLVADHSGLSSDIEDLENQIGNFVNIMNFRGVSTTDPKPLDGSTGKVTISGTVVTDFKPGDVVVYNGREFVYTTSTTSNPWEELGNVTRLAQLEDALNNHLTDTSNPHQVTKVDVELGNVDNVKQYSASNPPPYPVTSVAGKTGVVILNKTDVGLGSVDNTSDSATPVSGGTTKFTTGGAYTLKTSLENAIGAEKSAREQTDASIRADLTAEVTRATNAESSLQAVDNTLFKDVSVDGRKVTFTKHNGTTKEITTQDTTYSFSAANPTLAWGTTQTIGTAGDATYKVTMPANPNTDTKVTSVDNHYAPSTDSTATLSVDASTSATTGTAGSTSVVTGVNLQRDAKGHVTGVTVDSIKLPVDNNTTYSAGAGINLSGTQFSNSGVRSITQDGSDGHKLNINTNGTTTTITIPDNDTIIKLKEVKADTASGANVTITVSDTSNISKSASFNVLSTLFKGATANINQTADLLEDTSSQLIPVLKSGTTVGYKQYTSENVPGTIVHRSNNGDIYDGCIAVADPKLEIHAATKKYVDNHLKEQATIAGVTSVIPVINKDQEFHFKPYTCELVNDTIVARNDSGYFNVKTPTGSNNAHPVNIEYLRDYISEVLMNGTWG